MYEQPFTRFDIRETTSAISEAGSTNGQRISRQLSAHYFASRQPS
jgi:hypothetical protein